MDNTFPLSDAKVLMEKLVEIQRRIDATPDCLATAVTYKELAHIMFCIGRVKRWFEENPDG